MWYTVCVNAMMKFAHAHKRSKERPPRLKAVVRALRAFRFGAGRVKATDDRAPVAFHGGAVIRQKEPALRAGIRVVPRRFCSVLISDGLFLCRDAVKLR